MSKILHHWCSLVWNMGLFTSAQLFNAGRNSRQTHSQFLVYRKKSLTFLIFYVGQLIFRDSKAGMVPSTLGMCRYISQSEIVCRGLKNFENPCFRVISVSNTAYFFRHCFIYLLILWHLVLKFLWTEVKDCDSWNHKQHCAGFTPVYDPNMTGKISKQLCTSGVPSGGLNGNLRTRRSFWNVPDQIVTSSSRVMTAVFLYTTQEVSI